MLIELLRRAASAAPEQPAIISAGATRSYGTWLWQSENVARGLIDRRIERFGCAVDDPADTLVMLAGSSAAGSEACVYTRWLDAHGVAHLAATLGHRVVVADETLSLNGPEALSVRALSTDGPAVSAPAASPVLILTTGTTGAQKAARYDWARLVEATETREERPGQRWLLAYNLAQFGGIQMLLHALTSRSTLVAPASRRPDDAIEAIRRHGVTRASATPTFWRLVTATVGPAEARELALEQITLGGEAAPESLLQRLRALFPCAKISHVYAGTEFGSAVSVSDGRSGLPLSVLDRDDDARVRLRVVEGELQIRSRVGMDGYQHEADQALVWHATGDLVEIRDDRIHFVGRSSEVINVAGAKVHPLPIEDLAATVDGVDLAAAYGRPNPVTGNIVALDVVAAPGTDSAALEARIRSACEALPRAARPRRIRIVSELEIRGQKLIRNTGG